MASDTGTPGPSDVIEESGSSTYKIGSEKWLVLHKGVLGAPGPDWDSVVSRYPDDPSHGGDLGDSDTPGVDGEPSHEDAVDKDPSGSLLTEEE